MPQGRIFRLFACVLAVVLLIALCFAALHVNATTAALTFILLVLIVATYWGLREAVWTSVLCVLGFNFFFLPPIGTFTISDPQNWVALGAFLLTAVTVGQLSARAKERTREASDRRAQLERLYSLSRSMLLTDSKDVIQSFLESASGVFGFERIAFYDLAAGRVYGDFADAPLSAGELQQVAKTETPLNGPYFSIVPVQLGSRPIGSLGFGGPEIARAERDSIANLIAINFARAEALEKAASAEAARLGEQLKTSVLDGIAHDLKTPLTAIKTCVSTLISIPPRTEEKRMELLSIIDEETDRLRNRINSAIQLARFDAGSLEVNPQKSALPDLISGALAFFEGKRTFVLSVENISVWVDRPLLEEALKQILENALKYSPLDKPVEIQAAKTDGELRIGILDEGPGIHPSEIDMIFDKFYRGSRGRAGLEGTGLGLSVARGIVQAHGGTIRAENRPSRGAKISIVIPGEI